MLRILLIRHAESASNVKVDIVGGQSNHTPLTEKGENQARLLGKRFLKENLQFDEIHCSTAVRAMKTMEIATKEIGFDLNKVKYSDKLVELSQGDWTGRLRTEVYTPENLALINANPWHFKAPNGESQYEVEQRAYQYLDEHILALKDKTVAVFAHGLTIKCLLRKFLNSEPAMTWKILTENTSITTLSLREQGWFLEKVNDYEHLKEM